MSRDVPQIEVGQPEGLIEVHLLGIPVPVHQRAAEHSDELQREFALLQVQQAEDADLDVPARLLALIDTLHAQFGGFTSAAQTELEEAIDEGRERVDIVFRVPPEATAGARQLGALLDEADDFCRGGGTLLTLATPPEALAYRRWYLGEFVRQADGHPPTPWPRS